VAYQKGLDQGAKLTKRGGKCNEVVKSEVWVTRQNIEETEHIIPAKLQAA
jgi:hypothetical protein